MLLLDGTIDKEEDDWGIEGDKRETGEGEKEEEEKAVKEDEDATDNEDNKEEEEGGDDNNWDEEEEDDNNDNNGEEEWYNVDKCGGDAVEDEKRFSVDVACV